MNNLVFEIKQFYNMLLNTLTVDMIIMSSLELPGPTLEVSCVYHGLQIVNTYVWVGRTI